MVELGAWLRCGRPLLFLTCIFAPFLGQPGAGPAARAPYAGKAPGGGPVWVRANGPPCRGRWGEVGGRQALQREAGRVSEGRAQSAGSYEPSCTPAFA